MKAKFVNEDIRDILKPKDYMEIHNNIFGANAKYIVPFEEVKIGDKLPWGQEVIAKGTMDDVEYFMGRWPGWEEFLPDADEEELNDTNHPIKSRLIAYKELDSDETNVTAYHINGAWVEKNSR